MSPLSIAGTAYPFPGESHAHATSSCVESAPSARAERNPDGLRPIGKSQLQLDVARSGRRSQADERNRILFEILRLARDRRTGREIRDGVIPQHDRSVKSGGQVVDANPPR